MTKKGDEGVGEPLEKTIVLACTGERAFVLFTDHASEWWPPSRRHTPDADSTIVIEHAIGGRFFERARDGHEAELGRVVAWAPPQELALDFYVGTDREHPTRVVVTFESEGDGTRVTVRHGPLPTSESLYRQRAPRFDQSWDLVLAALAQRALMP